MTDLQKEAIEKLNLLNDYKQTYYGYQWFKVEVKADDETKETINIILNLINNLEDKIKELEKALIDDDFKHREEIKKYQLMLGQQIASTVSESFKTKYKHDDDLNMLYEGCLLDSIHKDRVIDAMASFIEVFELDEEISKTYCSGSLRDCKHKEDVGTCKKCIIEYFENQIKNKERNKE